MVSWATILKGSTGGAVISKADQAYNRGFEAGRKEGHAEGFRTGRQAAMASTDIELERARGYVEALRRAVWAVEATGAHTGRKQILALLAGQLEVRQSDLEERESDEGDEGGDSE